MIDLVKARALCAAARDQFGNLHVTVDGALDALTLLPEALDEIERLKAEHWTDAAVRVDAENARLRTLMRSLLNKVNRVTAPYRHGNPVASGVLAELAQRQIDVEAALAAPQTGGADV